MKITKNQIIDDHSLIGHIVLNGLGRNEKLCKKIAEDGEAELILTVNGEEIDIESFVDHWQSQVKEMIERHACQLFEDRVDKFRDTFFELTSRMEENFQKYPSESYDE